MNLQFNDPISIGEAAKKSRVPNSGHQLEAAITFHWCETGIHMDLPNRIEVECRLLSMTNFLKSAFCNNDEQKWIHWEDLHLIMPDNALTCKTGIFFASHLLTHIILINELR